MRDTRSWRTLSALLAGVLLVAGCGPGGFSGAYNMPLPGGSDLGDDPYAVRAQFDDALNLVPQAAVKVDSVPVGTVKSIGLSSDTTSAVVTMELNDDVDLPANATAQIRQESILGAKFVALSPPADDDPHGELSDGDKISQQRTGSTAEIEEVFGALSMLLSGGGVEQIRSIAKELNNALGGNEAEIRSLLSKADRMATELDGQRGDIVRAIDGLDELSETLDDEDDNLKDVLDNLGPGLEALDDQQDDLVEMLDSLHDLADVSVDVVNKSGEQTVENLKSLQPILERLAESGQDLPNAMRILPTYPYPAYAGQSIHGDYANVDVKVDFRLDSLIDNFKGYKEDPGDEIPDSLADSRSDPADEDPSKLPLPEVDGDDDDKAAQSEDDSDEKKQDGDPAGQILDGLLGGGS